MEKIFGNDWSQKINLALNYALVALAFVTPLSRSGISLFVGLVVILWIAEGNWKAKWDILRKDRLVLSIAAFCGWVLLSLLWTENYPKAVENMKNYGHFVLVPVILVSLIPRFRLFVFRAYAAGVTILIVLSILNYFLIFVMNPRHAGLPNVLMHHLDFSMFLAVTAIFGMAFALFRKESFVEGLQMRVLDWVLWGAASGLSLVWIFVQQGRSGQLALFVSMPILIIIYFWRRNKLYIIGGISLILVLFYSQFQFNNRFRTRILDIRYDLANVKVEGFYTSSVGYRILAWKISLYMISQNPVFGYGIGDAMDNFKKVIDSWEEMPNRVPLNLPDMHVIVKNHVHNQYLQVLLETGIIGLILFLFIWGVFLWYSPCKKMALLVMILFATGFIAEPFMRNQFISLLFCFFMGIINKINKTDRGPLS